MGSGNAGDIKKWLIDVLMVLAVTLNHKKTYKDAAAMRSSRLYKSKQKEIR